MRRKVLVSEENGACYCIGEPINHGVFSSVYKCYSAQTTYLQYAVKIYNRGVMEKYPDSRQVLANEVTALYAIQSPYICNKIDTFDSDRNIYIIMEYAHNGNLLEFIKKATSSEGARVRDATARRWLQQLLWGLADIHGAGFAHCDIKPENLLIDKHNDLKICDFGFCVKFSRPAATGGGDGAASSADGGGEKGGEKGGSGGGGELLTQDSGTPLYAAPELLEGEGYDGFMADVWSLGVTLYVMLTGSLPFFARTSEELFARIKSGRVPENPSISPSAMHFLRCCLEVDPKKRWSVTQLLHHPYCRGLKKMGGHQLDTPETSLTPVSTQTSMFPTVPSVEHADAMFFGASHSFTSLRENGGRILNERQLQLWKDISSARRTNSGAGGGKSIGGGDAGGGGGGSVSSGSFASATTPKRKLDHPPHTRSGESMDVFEIAEEVGHGDGDGDGDGDDDGQCSVNSRQSMREKLEQLHTRRSPTFEDDDGNDGEQNRPQSACSNQKSDTSSSIVALSPSSGAMRGLGMRKIMSKEGLADLADDEKKSSSSSGRSQTLTGSSSSKGRDAMSSGAGGGGPKMRSPQNQRSSNKSSSLTKDMLVGRQSRSNSLVIAGERQHHHGRLATAPVFDEMLASSSHLRGHLGGSSGLSAKNQHSSFIAERAGHRRTLSTTSSQAGVGSVRAATVHSTSSNQRAQQQTTSRGTTPTRRPSSGGTILLQPQHQQDALTQQQLRRLSPQQYHHHMNNRSPSHSNENKNSPPLLGTVSSTIATDATSATTTSANNNNKSPPLPRNVSTPSAQAELNRVMNVNRPSIYLRLEWAHFRVLVRWCIVVIQFVVWAVLRVLFNIKLENYIAVEGPLARFLNVQEEEEKEKED